MQVTFVRLDDHYREFLEEMARQESRPGERAVTMSDLIRRAVKGFYKLPSEGLNQAIKEERLQPANVTGPSVAHGGDLGDGASEPVAEPTEASR